MVTFGNQRDTRGYAAKGYKGYNKGYNINIGYRFEETRGEGDVRINFLRTKGGNFPNKKGFIASVCHQSLVGANICLTNLQIYQLKKYFQKSVNMTINAVRVVIIITILAMLIITGKFFFYQI